MKLVIESCCKTSEIMCEECGKPTDLLVNGDKFMCRDCIKDMIDKQK